MTGSKVSSSDSRESRIDELISRACALGSISGGALQAWMWLAYKAGQESAQSEKKPINTFGAPITVTSTEPQDDPTLPSDKHDELIRALRTQDPHDTDEVIKVMNAAARVLESLPSAEGRTYRDGLKDAHDYIAGSTFALKDAPVVEAVLALLRSFQQQGGYEKYAPSAIEPIPAFSRGHVGTVARALAHGCFDILHAPCVFCGYSGAGYWQAGTHADECPLQNVGGMTERRDYLTEGTLIGTSERTTPGAGA